MLDTHRVSLASLDAMAAGSSDPVIVERLRHTNRSRQLILMRAVLDRARTLGSALAPLPPLDDAWTLLANAQQRDPAAAELVLAHPRTGLWAAQVLRRLSGTHDTTDPPLWADLGHLHVLATSAAIRAGLHFRCRVPVWRGTVMLPTLGLADVQGRREWDFAQVHGEDGRVLVRGLAGSVRLPADPAADGTGWLPLHRVDVTETVLWLDDLDPHREFGEPVPPRRLPPAEVRQWSDRLRDTWRLLTEHHQAIAAELATGLNTLVPRLEQDPHTPFSASHNDAFGAVVLSPPPDPTTFAATLVHEFQHSKLGVLLALVDLLDPAADNDTERLYAPWRDDPRPPTGVLHGVFSFLGVTGFYRAHRGVESGGGARSAHFEFAYRREQTLAAVDSLLTEALPSALGRRFLGTVRASLLAWGAEPLPADVLAAASRANTDHRLLWRIRQLEIPAASVTEAAMAWLRHRPNPFTAPPAPALRAWPDRSPAPRARLALTRTWLIDPDLFDAYRTTPELAMAEVAGTTRADLALIEGALPTAARKYREDIMAHLQSPAAWAGLALATGEPVLLQHPEWVHAVHAEIRSSSGLTTDPLRLAHWLR